MAAADEDSPFLPSTIEGTSVHVDNTCKTLENVSTNENLNSIQLNFNEPLALPDQVLFDNEDDVRLYQTFNNENKTLPHQESGTNISSKSTPLRYYISELPCDLPDIPANPPHGANSVLRTGNTRSDFVSKSNERTDQLHQSRFQTNSTRNEYNHLKQDLENMENEIPFQRTSYSSISDDFQSQAIPLNKNQQCPNSGNNIENTWTACRWNESSSTVSGPTNLSEQTITYGHDKMQGLYQIDLPSSISDASKTQPNVVATGNELPNPQVTEEHFERCIARLQENIQRSLHVSRQQNFPDFKKSGARSTASSAYIPSNCERVFKNGYIHSIQNLENMANEIPFQRTFYSSISDDFQSRAIPSNKNQQCPNSGSNIENTLTACRWNESSATVSGPSNLSEQTITYGHDKMQGLYQTDLPSSISDASQTQPNVVATGNELPNPQVTEEHFERCIARLQENIQRSLHVSRQQNFPDFNKSGARSTASSASNCQRAFENGYIATRNELLNPQVTQGYFERNIKRLPNNIQRSLSVSRQKNVRIFNKPYAASFANNPSNCERVFKNGYIATRNELLNPQVTQGYFQRSIKKLQDNIQRSLCVSRQENVRNFNKLYAASTASSANNPSNCRLAFKTSRGPTVCEKKLRMSKLIANKRNPQYYGESRFDRGNCKKSLAGSSQSMRKENVPPAEKKFNCGFCGKSFYRRSHLQGHERTHTE